MGKMAMPYVCLSPQAEGSPSSPPPSQVLLTAVPSLLLLDLGNMYNDPKREASHSARGPVLFASLGR